MPLTRAEQLIDLLLARQQPRAVLEKTLMGRVPGVTAVRDATDHDSGHAPYIPRGNAA